MNECKGGINFFFVSSGGLNKICREEKEKELERENRLFIIRQRWKVRRVERKNWGCSDIMLFGG